MPKLWQQAAAASLAVLVAVLLPAAAVFADSKPYFQTSYGGPFAGGWFDQGSACRGSAQYQSPYNPAGTPNYYKGAIMAFSTVSGSNRQGAHSNLDAFALGKIEGPGPSGSGYGFYTGTGSSGTGGLSFANVNSGISDFWGGNLEGLLSYAHCIPDYYGTKKSASATQSLSGNVTITGRTLNGGNRQIIFVDGNAYISGDIKYGAYNATNIPQFALVVKGNIYIDPSVSRLDGWYIAQPNGSSDGVIWTCHDNSSDQPTDRWMRDRCDDQRLTVNGALTAAQVNLGRISGDISDDPAENIVFQPEMVLSGPFFDDTSASASSTGAIQSLINLPPIF